MIRFHKTTYNDEFMVPYIKKPIQIKAIQVTEPFCVETLEGNMKGKAGDYLVKGIQGELYPVDKIIFQKTYDSKGLYAVHQNEAHNDQNPI